MQILNVVLMNRLLMKSNETRIFEHTNLNRPKASVNCYIKRLAKLRNGYRDK
jgi:hypothetical protein